MPDRDWKPALQCFQEIHPQGVNLVGPLTLNPMSRFIQCPASGRTWTPRNLDTTIKLNSTPIIHNGNITSIGLFSDEIRFQHRLDVDWDRDFR
jgi:hypothetical protein